MAGNNNSNQPPAPEELKPQDETQKPTEPVSSDDKSKKDSKLPKPKHRGSYRPSHKATFLALIVVILILVVNGGVIGFILMRQSSIKSKVNDAPVTISAGALAKLGVNNTPVNDKGITLTVNPNAQFNGNLAVAGSASIAGQLTLNNKFTAVSASFNSLQAGNTSLSQLNVNGDGTLSSLNLRQNLAVAGATQMQGAVTVSQMLTAANIEVTGNLAVGGTISVNNFHTGNLAADNTLTVGGHVITAGSAPGVSGGACGGATNSGNDASGAIFIPVGAGGCSGMVASLHFRNSYSNIPHIVITPVLVSGGGQLPVFYLSSVSASGFSIGVSGTLTASVYIDYVVEQ